MEGGTKCKSEPIECNFQFCRNRNKEGKSSVDR